MSINQEITEIKPYSTKDLSKIYGVDERTIKKWMKPFAEQIGKRQGRFYNVVQVKLIFEKLGLPHRIVSSEW